MCQAALLKAEHDPGFGVSDPVNARIVWYRLPLKFGAVIVINRLRQAICTIIFNGSGCAMTNGSLNSACGVGGGALKITDLITALAQETHIHHVLHSLPNRL